MISFRKQPQNSKGQSRTIIHESLKIYKKQSEASRSRSFSKENHNDRGFFHQEITREPRCIHACLFSVHRTLKSMSNCFCLMFISKTIKVKMRNSAKISVHD